jgi:hypothetical protein
MATMSELETTLTRSTDSRATFSRFARGATVGGLLPMLPAALVLYDGWRTRVPGTPGCGQAAATFLGLFFVVHVLCELGGVVSAGIALTLPKDGPDHAPALWLAISGTLLTAWLGLFLWGAFLR